MLFFFFNPPPPPPSMPLRSRIRKRRGPSPVLGAFLYFLYYYSSFITPLLLRHRMPLRSRIRKRRKVPRGCDQQTIVSSDNVTKHVGSVAKSSFGCVFLFFMLFFSLTPLLLRHRMPLRSRIRKRRKVPRGRGSANNCQLGQCQETRRICGKVQFWVRFFFFKIIILI
jgi:hypothetical protein